MKHRPHIHLRTLKEITFATIQYRAAVDNTRAIHQNINIRVCLLAQFDRLHIADIKFDACDTLNVGIFLYHRFISIGRDDYGTFLGKFKGYGLTNTLCGPVTRTYLPKSFLL